MALKWLTFRLVVWQGPPRNAKNCILSAGWTSCRANILRPDADSRRSFRGGFSLTHRPEIGTDFRKVRCVDSKDLRRVLCASNWTHGALAPYAAMFAPPGSSLPGGANIAAYG